MGVYHLQRLWGDLLILVGPRAEEQEGREGQGREYGEEGDTGEEGDVGADGDVREEEDGGERGYLREGEWLAFPSRFFWKRGSLRALCGTTLYSREELYG